ncbi:MAG: cyanophycin synthetase, partial [Crocinitomicaceae bacterium]|nr:cyanophycin synthetase [Crocinitomicaceae bacterium]
GTRLSFEGKEYPLSIFGRHNLQNLMGAMKIAKAMGIKPDDYLTAMESFTGAGKRLQKVSETEGFTLYKDFAHSPSKLKATTSAVKEQYPDRIVVACMELHTFSSLKKEFLPQYENAMNAADVALVYFSPEVVAHKKLEPISVDMVSEGFGPGVKVVTSTAEVRAFLGDQSWPNSVLLMMSSGNFDGINYDDLGEGIVEDLL